MLNISEVFLRNFICKSRHSTRSSLSLDGSLFFSCHCYSPSYLSDNSGKFSAPHSQPGFRCCVLAAHSWSSARMPRTVLSGESGFGWLNWDGIASIMGWGIILPQPRMKRLAEMIAYCLMVTIKSGFKHFITFCIQSGFRGEI